MGILGIPWNKNVHGASIVAKKRRLQCLDISEQILGAALLQFAHRSNLHREKLQWRRPLEFRGYPLWPCVFIGKIYGNEVFNIVQAIKFGGTHLFSGPFDHLVHAWQPGCGVACVVPSEPSTYANWSYQRYHAILLGKWVCHKLWTSPINQVVKPLYCQQGYSLWLIWLGTSSIVWCARLHIRFVTSLTSMILQLSQAWNPQSCRSRCEIKKTVGGCWWTKTRVALVYQWQFNHRLGKMITGLNFLVPCQTNPKQPRKTWKWSQICKKNMALRARPATQHIQKTAKQRCGSPDILLAMVDTSHDPERVLCPSGSPWKYRSPYRGCS